MNAKMVLGGIGDILVDTSTEDVSTTSLSVSNDDEVLEAMMFTLLGFGVVLLIILVSLFATEALMKKREARETQVAAVGDESTKDLEGGGRESKDAATMVRGFLRSIARVVLVIWAFVGIGVSVYLVVSFFEYLSDQSKLEGAVLQQLKQSSTLGSTLNTRFENSTEADGISLISTEKFIPATDLALVVKSFNPVPSDEPFFLYGVDWMDLRCRPSCTDLDTLVQNNDESGPGYSLKMVTALKGMHPRLIRFLIAALFIDALTLTAFAVVVCYRYCTYKKRKKRLQEINSLHHGKKTSLERLTFLFEVGLLCSGIGILIKLILLANAVPVQYDALAFIHDRSDNSKIAAPITPKVEYAFTEPYTYNYIFEFFREESAEYCPGVLPTQDYKDVPDEDFLFGPPRTTGLLPTCMTFAGDKTFRSILTPAESWTPVIEYVKQQILGQSVIIDVELIVMDILVLFSSYYFIIL